MSFTPDEQEKTVKIPVQVRAGQIQFYFDGPLPELKEGSIGDLVLPYYAVRDPKARKLFSEERKIPLFKKKPRCTSNSIRSRTTPSLSRPIFYDRFQRAPGNIFSSTKKHLSTITRAICCASLPESSFRMFSICNYGAPKRRPSLRPCARYRLSTTRRRAA